MATNGLKSLDWRSFSSIKQDLLYFDKIYFDSYSLTKYKAIREWTNKLGAIGEYLIDKNLWNEKLNPEENIEIAIKMFQKELSSKEDIEKKIEQLFSNSQLYHDHKQTESDIEFLLQHGLIDTINPYNYFRLNSTTVNASIPFTHEIIEKLIIESAKKGEKSMANSHFITPNFKLNNPQKSFELSAIAIESLFFSAGNIEIPIFGIKSDPAKLVLNGQEIGRWHEAQNKMLKLITMLENEINSDYHYVPIFNNASDITSNTRREDEVLKLVLNKFPVVSDDTPFEKIIDFREDSANKLRLFELRKWIRTISKSDLDLKYVKEEIEYLLEKYKHELNLRKIKFKQTPLEIFVVTTLDILSNTLKLDWGEAAKKIFSIKKEKVDYLIDLDNVVGKEIAYIQAVNDNFKKG